MKKIILSVLLIVFSSQTFAAKVCTHKDFAKKYPSVASRLGNCPGDTPSGNFTHCLDSDGVTVLNFFCDSSLGWVRPILNKNSSGNELSDQSEEAFEIEDHQSLNSDEELLQIESK